MVRRRGSERHTNLVLVAGGSGFVWTKETELNVTSSYSVSKKYFLIKAKTVAGNVTNGMPTHNGVGTMTGNEIDGYAKITDVTGIINEYFK